MKTAIYFMLKASLFIRYLNFCIDFLARLENGWIRKLRLVLRFMTSHTGQQIITIHILPNISGSKSNQAMKCGMLKKRSQKVFFSKIIQKMRQGDQFQTSFCFFKKPLYKIKASDQDINFNICWQTSAWTCNKNEL